MIDSMEYVIRLIEKKVKLPKDVDIDSFDYIESGYVDSLGIIKFILEIEAEYDIEISDSDIESSEFRTVGGLISFVNMKIRNKVKN